MDRIRKRSLIIGASGVLLLPAIVAGSLWHARSVAADRLLRTPPASIGAGSELENRAVGIARPVYARHCASCHGAALEGDMRRGVPNLAARAWLYGNDRIDVEHTILYGIRSGHPKARNVTDMPALVRTGQITAAEARDVVEYVQNLSGKPADAILVERGKAIYFDKGNCYDCHGDDARGVIDYGTPSLQGPVWLYGGDRDMLYQSILNGRHGSCPAWIRVLTPLQIRALTIYLTQSGPSHAGSS
jgi:cytochrome c oxidase cbb3-type subunit 3